MGAFGANTDHYGLADTNIKLIASSKAPNSQIAQAMDSQGDVTAETVFDTFYSFECQYRKVAGASLTLDTIAQVGQIISSIGITGIAVATNNTERPTFTVTGETYFGDTSTSEKYASGIAILATKTAQDFSAFTCDTVTRVVSTSATMSSQVDRAQDSQGQTVATAIYQGRLEVSGELQSATAVAAATADTGYTLNGPIGNTEEHTGYGNSTINVFKNVSGA